MKEFVSLNGLQPGEVYSATGIVSKIVKEGVPESKRPIVILFQSENNGVKIKISSWDYGMMDIYKANIEKRNICKVEFRVKEYNNDLSFNLVTLESTDKVSELPIEEQQPQQEVNSDYMKSDIVGYIEQVQNPTYKAILDNLLLLYNNEFYVWPASKVNHHSFPGGLVLHSYNVCSNAVNMANQYNSMQGLVIDYDLLITGSLLHDIGKLKELNQNGDYTHLGMLMSHIVLGVEMIDSACDQLGLDKYSEEIIRLKHLVLSHHGKLEFGSPNTPLFIEAYLLHYADMTDSKCESMVEALNNMNTGEISSKIQCLDGGKIIKTY